MKRIAMTGLLALSVCLLPPAAWAAAPPFLPVQGFLQDSAGNAISGDVSIAFTLYDAEVGGNAVWTETQSILVEEGLFAVYLGEAAAVDLGLFNTYTHLWLGIQVESDPEMDRVYLGSTPYTGYAQYCGNIPDHGHAWTEITGADGVAEGAQTCSGSDKAVGIDISGLLVCATDQNTTYLAGTGLTLTGTTFAVNTSAIQARVTGTCATGSAIRVVAADGTVTCASIPGAHTHDAADITTGTLVNGRFSAYGDLTSEGAIGTGAGQVAAGNHTHAVCPAGATRVGSTCVLARCHTGNTLQENIAWCTASGMHIATVIDLLNLAHQGWGNCCGSHVFTIPGTWGDTNGDGLVWAYTDLAQGEGCGCDPDPRLGVCATDSNYTTTEGTICVSYAGLP
jgi:hypothetical protein